MTLATPAVAELGPRPSADQPPEPAASRSRLPRAASRHGAALLNQQFWLWGQDIRRPQGNLLLGHGFLKTRPPEGLRASTRYDLVLSDGAQVVLWGFGLFYADPDPAGGALYLGRFRLSPRLAAAAPSAGWSPAELPELAVPESPAAWSRAGTLLVPALRWIAAYEAWVRAEAGADYRRACLDRWSRPIGSAEDVAARWLRLSHRCGDSLRRAADDRAAPKAGAYT